jgi:large subunit ribosomal protein L18
MSDYLKKRVRQVRQRRARAHQRLRAHLRGTAERPRLAVFKSLNHVYAQVIDDDRGHTLVQASTLDADLQGKLGAASKANRAAAAAVGTAVAQRARAQGIDSVVFDRGGYIYHGKVRAIAEAAREAGLKF